MLRTIKLNRLLINCMYIYLDYIDCIVLLIIAIDTNCIFIYDISLQ